MKFLVVDTQTGKYAKLKEGGFVAEMSWTANPAEATVFSDRSSEGVLFHEYEWALRITKPHFEKVSVKDPAPAASKPSRKHVSLHFRSGNIVTIECDSFRLTLRHGDLGILFENASTKVDYINYKEVVLITHQEVEA